jgi:glycosyltransferase involved in cell wall biosynthesis
MNLITVLIRTINRSTLSSAIKSALNEFNDVMVVADAVDLNFKDLPTNVNYLRTGRKFDQYGNACINMGAYACRTPYFCLLDDDDEFMPGAGDFMRSRVVSHPEVDIWIPGLNYIKEGFQQCMDASRGLVIGNVAVPTYKTELLFKLPFFSNIGKAYPTAVDFFHVEMLQKMGCNIAWYGKALYNIRPNLPGTNGAGL